MDLSQVHADIVWMLVCAALVMVMQGGFCLLESGLARAKNSINVAIKNAVDFCISMLLFWLCGFGLMFGTSRWGLFGTDHFLPGGDADPWLLAFFLFQVVFCGTATTIISGAVAERARFSGYLLITIVVSGVLYPVFGHWAWGGVVPGTEAGWLAKIGFVDFAGSTVVHSLGGWAALAAAIVIGPRLGRFSEKRTPIIGHNLPMATIGTLLLWFGWFGFNGGSTLAVDDAIPLVLVNTNLAAAAGGLAALALSWARDLRPNVGEVLNGIIAGLVGVTACCHVVDPVGAVVVGMGAALVCTFGTLLLAKLRVDDVIGAVPAHAMAGAWGTLAVALYGKVERFGTGLDRLEQLRVQAIGVGTCFAWSFGVGLLLFAVAHRFRSLRVERRAECEGLNVAEHGASTELVDLLSRMSAHRERGQFTRVAVEPHTEVGQIATEYNRVLARVAEEMSHRDAAMHAARAAEEKYRTIFENAVGGIYRSTPDGRLVDANPALADLLGYETPGQLLGAVRDVGHGIYANPSRRAEFVAEVERRNVLEDFESRARRRCGTIITINETARTVRDENGRVLFYEGTIEDVTERRHAEELEREKEAADARDRAKSAFLANMSHEIRTPLNGVVGMLELLTRTALDDRQSRYVRVATSSADALLSLINDILDFSKIEAGKLEVERIPFDLPVLLEDVAEMFGHQAAERGLELVCFVRPDVPDRVIGDPERLRQILVNLVGNALKFTEVGEVRLEATVDPDRPFVQIAVADTGIGIDPARQLELFTPFAQLDASTTRKYGGTGLGLAICGQLADLMGGTMSVDSAPAEGTTFTCRLPLPEAGDLRDRPNRGANGHGLAGVRVLAVDDNETNREILQEQLAAWGVDVEVYGDPETVLEVLDLNVDSDRPFQLAVLDQHMPGMTGVQLVEAIRKRPEWNDLRIAILSSVDDVVNADTADRLGIGAAMTKPIRQSRLFDVLVGLWHGGTAEVAHSSERRTPGASTRLAGRVLVAEDNDVNQLVVREILEEFGIECEIVPNGAVAVAKLRRQSYDLVLMDCQMPELDGFEATRLIRELESAGELGGGDHVRIVALTANAVKGDREKCLEAGMDDYVTKPIDPSLLFDKLAEVLDPVPEPDVERDSERQVKGADEKANRPRDTRDDVSEAAAEPTDVDSSHAAIDLRQLETRCLGKTALVQRVLRKFVSRLESDCSALAAAAGSGRAEELRRLAHGLKGAAGNVAADCLAARAADVETAAHEGDLVAARLAFDGLVQAADECRREVTLLLGDPTTSSPAKFDTENSNPTPAHVAAVTTEANS